MLTEIPWLEGEDRTFRRENDTTKKTSNSLMKEAKEGRILGHCGLIYGRLNTLDVLEVSSVRQNRRKQHSPGLLADELETCREVNGVELSPGVR